MTTSAATPRPLATPDIERAVGKVVGGVQYATWGSTHGRPEHFKGTLVKYDGPGGLHEVELRPGVVQGFTSREIRWTAKPSEPS